MLEVDMRQATAVLTAMDLCRSSNLSFSLLTEPRQHGTIASRIGATTYTLQLIDYSGYVQLTFVLLTLFLSLRMPASSAHRSLSPLLRSLAFQPFPIDHLVHPMSAPGVELRLSVQEPLLGQEHREVVRCVLDCARPERDYERPTTSAKTKADSLKIGWHWRERTIVELHLADLDQCWGIFEEQESGFAAGFQLLELIGQISGPATCHQY